MLKWILTIVAVVGALSGTVLAVRSTSSKPAVEAASAPVTNPFPRGISGAGIVEPASENVVIGVSEPGLVTNVFVKRGQQVKAGQPLFEIDARKLQAELPTAQAAVLSSEAELERIQAYRRKEDEALLKAKVAQAEAAALEALVAIADARATVSENEWFLKDQQERMKRWEMTVKSGASPEEELDKAKYAVSMAEAKLKSTQEKVRVAQAREKGALAFLEQARAELQTYKAGPWEPDVKKARAALAESRSAVERIQREIERHTVRAPLDASVIRLNLREGEYAVAGSGRADAEDAPVVLGNLDRLHIRVDIDEFDAAKFKPGMKATMFARSDRHTPVALEYVSVEPFIVPKRALTNSQRELVDTRVLQVIYRISDAGKSVYVGQQVDVFFDR